MDKLRKTLSGDEGDEEKGVISEIVDASSLSYSTRIKGFILCFALGCVLSILGACLFWVNLSLFAVFYSLGNICAIGSTCFLKGPVSQVKSMFQPTRVLATICVFLFLALTFMAAFWWKKNGLVLFFCVLEFLAFTWYGLSYIPYARDAVKKCAESCLF